MTQQPRKISADGYTKAQRVRAAQQAIMAHAEALGIEQDEATLVDELVKSLGEFSSEGNFRCTPLNLPRDEVILALAAVVQAVEYTPLGVRGLKAVHAAKVVLATIQEDSTVARYRAEQIRDNFGSRCEFLETEEEKSTQSSLVDAESQRIATHILEAGDEAVLDSAVHDICSTMASGINNDGTAAQVKFLLSKDWTEAAILQEAGVDQATTDSPPSP